MLIIPAGQVIQLQDGNIVSRAGIHHSPKEIAMTNVQYLSQQYTFQQSKLFSLKKRAVKSQLNNYCPSAESKMSIFDAVLAGIRSLI